MSGRNKRMIIDCMTKETKPAYAFYRDRKLKFLAGVKISKQVCKEKNRSKAKIYMNSWHRFEFRIGKIKTGIFRTMIGREAKKLNGLSYIKFCSHAGTDQSKPLSKWFWVSDENEPQVNK